MKRAILITWCFAISACSNHYLEKIKPTLKRVESDYQKELKNQIEDSKSASYRANWQKATADLLNDSPKIHATYFRLEDSLRRSMQVWKNMIPTLNLSLSESATIGEISDLFVDTNFRVSSFISFGNLIDLPLRIAENKLRYVGDELQGELTMRNEIIALYRIFREQELHDLEQDALQWERQLLEETTVDKNSMKYQIELEKLQEKEKSFAKKKESWRSKISDTLIRRYSSVRLDGSDLPNIYYRGENLDFSDTKRWGYLQMNLLALELFADEAQLPAAYKLYYPDPNLGVTAPPLYSSTNERDFDIEEFRLSPRLTWRLDTRGFISNQIRRIKRDAPNKIWTEEKRLVSQVSKLIDGKKALIELQQEIREHDKLVKEYKQLVEDGLIKDIEKILAQMKSFKQKEVSLKSAEVDIFTELWLIDEPKWTKITQQWKMARLAFKQRTRDKEKKDRLQWFKDKINL